MNSRISAFTLIELVLAMMLAAIVVGMAYAAFTLAGKMYGAYRQKNLAYADVQLLRLALEGDAEKAESLWLDEASLLLRSDTASGAKDLQYSWQRDILLRKTVLVVDTFRLPGLEVDSYFEGRSVISGLADRLVLSFRQDSALMQISVQKDYDSRALLNTEEGLWNR